MQVSVIIPVYNAERFVIQAVESALSQAETGEVILIEDGSSDNSLEVCQSLVEKYGKVRLLRHRSGRNLGAGASRNLAMKNAKFDFIAFLDADDYFLPGRFRVAEEIFKNDSRCDGVYEAIGRYDENEMGKKRWSDANRPDVQLHTLSNHVRPEELFECLVTWRYGDFSIDGLIIKRAILTNSGYMNESLRLHQDTDFIRRLAASGNLLPGRLEEPVSMWRVHEKNRISAPRSETKVYKDQMNMLVSTYRWCKKKGLKEESGLIFEKMISYCLKYKPVRPLFTKLPKWKQQKIHLVFWIFQVPDVVMENRYWRKLLPITFWNFYDKKTK